MTITCHWHPDRQTGLTCGSCGKPVCTECMRHHPVGIRCKECAKGFRLPTFQLSSGYVIKGFAAMLGLGVTGGLGLVLVDWALPFSLFSLMMMIGLGYVIGEGISAAVNRKRGRPLQYLAAGAVIIAVVISALADVFLIGDRVGIGLFDLIGLGLAILVAVNRLRV